MNHAELMVDLETGGTAPNAVIYSIGAVIFDPYEPPQEIFEHTFYVNIDPVSCKAWGLEEEPDTLAWWRTQPQEARDRLLTDRTALPDALEAFKAFYWGFPQPVARHWANSPSFDWIKLQWAASTCGIDLGLRFWDERDVRTLKDHYYPHGNAPNYHDGAKHDALDDAKSQARLVQHLYQIHLSLLKDAGSG